MPGAVRPLDGRRILIVEDEYLIAIEIKRWLQHAGAEVVGPVPSVQRALDLIEDGGIDAAVLDLNLGDSITALPIADQLRGRGVPHLFATGDVQVACGNHQETPRLEKPFGKSELLRAVEELVASA